jgi:hypothetical protein
MLHQSNSVIFSLQTQQFCHKMTIIICLRGDVFRLSITILRRRFYLIFNLYIRTIISYSLYSLHNPNYKNTLYLTKLQMNG